MQLVKEPIHQVQLKGGKYALRRDRDGAGDAGPKLIAVNWVNGKMVGDHGQIIVGACVECGSITARSYSTQDFWLTTPVTEIVSVNEDASEVKFKTKNSDYTVTVF